MNHTPGPWTTEPGNNHIKIWGELPYRGAKLIAEVRNENDIFSTSGQQEKANAHLIAAAPELLAILSNILVWDDGNLPGDLMDHAKRVIAKAEGKE